jgi:hypothetical protein
LKLAEKKRNEANQLTNQNLLLFDNGDAARAEELQGEAETYTTTAMNLRARDRRRKTPGTTEWWNAQRERSMAYEREHGPKSDPGSRRTFARLENQGVDTSGVDPAYRGEINAQNVSQNTSRSGKRETTVKITFDPTPADVGERKRRANTMSPQPV